ncbi:MAG: replication-relaxation family protein [Cognatishimia sp.]|uniref:replication-relaxation family protein n=1 Tax=Cognatishimia sp. TaxID=2211648 RepID=UPI004058670D
MLSVHRLNRPTLSHLEYVHCRPGFTRESLRKVVRQLERTGYLSHLQQFDPVHPYRNLPYVFVDTTQSRRYLERFYGVPYRRISHKRRPVRVPTGDLNHDFGIATFLSQLHASAAATGEVMRYQDEIMPGGISLNHPVTVVDGQTFKQTSVKPDGVCMIGEWALLPEIDCGSMDVRPESIDGRSIYRKELAYDWLKRKDALSAYGFHNKRWIVPFTIQGKDKSQRGASRRVQTCLEKMPAHVNRQLFYFIEQHVFAGAGNQVHKLEWIRGDGVRMPLPCFQSPVQVTI